MSDPGYEDLYVNVKHDLKNVAGRCFVAPGTRNTRTRTRGNSVQTSFRYCAIVLLIPFARSAGK